MMDEAFCQRLPSCSFYEAVGIQVRRTQTPDFYRVKRRERPPPSHVCNRGSLCFEPSLRAGLPSQTGSHYRGSHPRRRWPFNTSLATANEPGAAAAACSTRPRPTLHKCLPLARLLCRDGMCTSTLTRFRLHIFRVVTASAHFEFLEDFVLPC